MGSLGIQELVLVLLIILIIFGAGKLPEVGAGIGKAIKNFKKATSDDTEAPIAKQNTDELEDKTRSSKS